MGSREVPHPLTRRRIWASLIQPRFLFGVMGTRCCGLGAFADTKNPPERVLSLFTACLVVAVDSSTCLTAQVTTIWVLNLRHRSIPTTDCLLVLAGHLGPWVCLRNYRLRATSPVKFEPTDIGELSPYLRYASSRYAGECFCIILFCVEIQAFHEPAIHRCTLISTAFFYTPLPELRPVRPLAPIWVSHHSPSSVMPRLLPLLPINYFSSSWLLYLISRHPWRVFILEPPVSGEGAKIDSRVTPTV